jgi:hypothetical protein
MLVAVVTNISAAGGSPGSRASRPRTSIIDFLAPADDDDMVSVSPGTYTYPFAYELPASLPASFQGKWGAIAYSARLSMERAGWRADDIEREQDITVRASYDLNEEPELVVSCRERRE